MKHVRRGAGKRSLQSKTLLGRLRIRSKLNLLLGLPLAAVLLVATPFVITQASSAASAQVTADAAGNTRELGGLIWELQRERLLTAAYIASPHSDPGQMQKQQRKVDDTVAQVRASLGTGISDELTSALARLGSLPEVRQNALRRGIAPDVVARTYHAMVDAIIGSLRLVAQQTSDAAGTRQLTALDALLHANEFGELRGMAFIATAVNKQAGQKLLDDCGAQAALFVERFVQQADVEHAGLEVSVVEGDTGRAVEALQGSLPDPKSSSAVEAYASTALNTVSSQSGLRRTVQDRVTSQITDAATSRADSAATLAWLIGGGAAGLFALVLLLSVVVSRSIASPLRKLTDAATSVADLAETELVRVSDTEEGVVEQAPVRLAEIEVNTADELGQLAVAFNRVQSTASGLVERQAVTRRNVSLMFANVAQRTQNLVGRQLALVDELERNEQDSRLLASLYRLDHLSTRLRRNADNLLVVAGSREENVLGSPIQLATALRSALAEIEDYQRVRISDMPEVTLSSVMGTDLVLLFAELLENAASFSPPDTFVEVSTAFGADGSCVVIIVDHGIGMKPPRLAEENQRLVERERLDVAPTSVLGLFVVGRLARRHMLNVMLVPTPSGGITARVTMPPTSFSRPMAAVLTEPELPAPMPVQEPMPLPAALPPVAPPPGRLPVPDVPSVAIPPARHTAGFAWFPAFESQDGWQSPAPAFHTGEQPVIRSPKPASEPVAVSGNGNRQAAGHMGGRLGPNDGESRSGLRRRVAGAQLPGAATVPTPTESVPAPPPPPARHAQHDPVAARDAFDGFQTAFANVAATPEVTPPPAEPAPPTEPEPVPAAQAQVPAERAGLSRRIPGANLAPGLRSRAISQPSARPTAPPMRLRDPASDRASFDAFSSGFARAVDSDPTKESTR
ncbi:sensor histidine kinase [Actinocrispum wychmicini]|uniref:histidine kinase n=1 Tax=Actinocrispum wychmicini TaxID=1213861 RepID=A0A4R2K7N3_9PSEU|nr:nitrate- and nitrite sensing domain-containing protein [Actinocrispum wychmicini]TCO62365.1 signal transduction histidine kinase [Actinocrispum wychmicini]